MADGTSRPIEDVNVGDKVMATDPVAGKSEPKQVTQLHRNTDKDLTDLTVRDQDGKVTKVETTWHHPFWNASKRKWDDAKDLKPGTKLLVKGKGAVTVVSVLNKLGVEEMRDLTVADIHTYYVIPGKTPVLVHNNDPGLINLGVTGDSCPVATRSEYYNMSTATKKGKPALTADEVQNLHDYARGSNAWLEANGPQVVQSTRLLQADMRAAIEAERRTNPGKYPPGWVPGHMPDTGVTGMASPPSWLPSPSRANSIAGGGLSSRIGKTLRGFLVDGVYIT